MTILHIEAGKKLYGGAKQVALIVGGLQEQGIRNHLACPMGSAISQEAASLGCVVHELKMGGELDIWQFFSLRHLMQQVWPDVVHIHSRRGADIWGALAAKSLKIPVVLSRRVDNPEARWLVKLKYPLYDRIITISEAIREVLLQEGVPASKIDCVRSAYSSPDVTPCARDEFLSRFQIPDGHFVMGVIAQLIPRKGHRYLLDVLPEILRNHPQTTCLFFGKGALHDEIRQQIRLAGLDDHVRLVGFVDDLESILSHLDLVVHPALMEGLGVALLQASAAGVPIVASGAGGIPEIVHHEQNGLLVPPADSQALGRAILLLLGDPEKREKMGQAGQQLIATSFSVEKMCAGNLAVYHRLLSPA